MIRRVLAADQGFGTASRGNSAISATERRLVANRLEVGVGPRPTTSA